jgi:hypothetical protein
MYMPVTFSGYSDLTMLTEQEMLAVADSFLSIFNDLADQVCDHLLRSLLRVELYWVPSQAPLISFMPSISAQPSQPPSIAPPTAGSNISGGSAIGSPWT